MAVLEIVASILNSDEFTKSVSKFEYDKTTDRLRFNYNSNEVELYLNDIRLKSATNGFIVNKSFSTIRVSEEMGARYIANYMKQSLQRRQATDDMKKADEKTYKIEYTYNGEAKTENVAAFSSMEAIRKFSESLGMRNTVYMEFISIMEI